MTSHAQIISALQVKEPVRDPCSKDKPVHEITIDKPVVVSHTPSGLKIDLDKEVKPQEIKEQEDKIKATSSTELEGDSELDAKSSSTLKVVSKPHIASKVNLLVEDKPETKDLTEAIKKYTGTSKYAPDAPRLKEKRDALLENVKTQLNRTLSSSTVSHSAVIHLSTGEKIPVTKTVGDEDIKTVVAVKVSKKEGVNAVEEKETSLKTLKKEVSVSSEKATSAKEAKERSDKVVELAKKGATKEEIVEHSKKEAEKSTKKLTDATAKLAKDTADAHETVKTNLDVKKKAEEVLKQVSEEPPIPSDPVPREELEKTAKSDIEKSTKEISDASDKMRKSHEELAPVIKSAKESKDWHEKLVKEAEPKSVTKEDIVKKAEEESKQHEKTTDEETERTKETAVKFVAKKTPKSKTLSVVVAHPIDETVAKDIARDQLNDRKLPKETPTKVLEVKSETPKLVRVNVTKLHEEVKKQADAKPSICN